MSSRVQNRFCSLSLPIYVSFIWIFVFISYCPIHVRAFDIVIHEEDIEPVNVTQAIKVCSENAFSSVGGILHSETHKSKGYHFTVPSYWVSPNVTTKFPLVIGETKCRRGSVIHHTLKRVDEQDLEYEPSKAHFYQNGYFRENNEIYAPDEYCIESFSQSLRSIELKLCKPNCGLGKKRPCIKKCCPLDKIFFYTVGKAPYCTSIPEDSAPFMPTFYDDLYTKSKAYSFLQVTDTVPATTTALMPHFIINYPKEFKIACVKNKTLPLPSSQSLARILSRSNATLHSSTFRIRTDGAIMYKSLENKCESMSPSLRTFCVDGLIAAPNFVPESSFNNTEDEYIIIQCQVPEKDPHKDNILSFIFGVLLVTTSIFPLVTSLVYLLLWKKQNVHGWTIAATSGSLFFMYIFHGTAHLIGITVKERALNTFYCRLLGVLVHFFMMSTFTWCSVMTFDLFITFRSVVPMNQRLQGVSRYLKYSLFGWGVPTLIVAIGILMDFVIYTSNDCSYHAVPAYGQKSCGIVESSMGEYLYYPAGFLLCVNISLFTATCVKLCMYGRATAIRARKNNDAFGECFSRFSKLFCVMGISWIFEIVSWYVDGLGYVWYWNIIDIFNILRAVAVFSIYVCKSDIIKQLDDSYPTLQRIYRPFGRLFMRKCSDEISVESTVLSAIPTSPATAMKTVNTSCATGRKKGRKETEGATCDL